MRVDKLKRPEWFTKEKYMQLRNDGYTKQDIWEGVLFVSQGVLERFLIEIGAENYMKGVRKQKYKRPEWFTFRKYESYKQIGMTDAELQKMLGVSYIAFRRFLDEIGVPRRPSGPPVRKGDETA